MGDAGLGFITAFHYDYNHQSAKNKKFVAAYNADFKRNPDMFSVGGYDGMHVIYEALKKTNGNTDGDKPDRRRQGHDMGEPARPDVDRSGDARRRRRPSTSAASRRSAASCVNVEFDKVENVKDPFKARLPK